MTTNFTFRMPEEAKAALEQTAKRYRVSPSLILRTLAFAQIEGLLSFRDYLGPEEVSEDAQM